MSQTHIDDDAVELSVMIPEGRTVAGLEYGAHLSGDGWSGYYVRPVGCQTWGYARQTPASDECYEDDEIVKAISEAIAHSR